MSVDDICWYNVFYLFVCSIYVKLFVQFKAKHNEVRLCSEARTLKTRSRYYRYGVYILHSASERVMCIVYAFRDESPTALTFRIHSQE